MIADNAGLGRRGLYAKGSCPGSRRFGWLRALAGGFGEGELKNSMPVELSGGTRRCGTVGSWWNRPTTVRCMGEGVFIGSIQ